MSKVAHIWRHRTCSQHDLSNLISSKIAEYEWMNPGALTDVRGGKELLLAGDYGGHHKEARYRSYAFLVANISDSGEWDARRKWLRSVLLTNGKRVSFKGIRARRSVKVLSKFLEAANYLPGLLVTFLIDKRLGRLISAKPDPCKFPEIVYIERGWNKRSFDRLSLIAHLGSLLVGGSCGTGQDLLWITDQDEIAPNPKKHDHAGWVLWYYVTKYAPDIGGKLVFITTEADLGKCRLEDAVSIPDLAAGALAEAVSTMGKQLRGKLDSLAVPIPEGFSERTDTILQWLAQGGFPLSRLAVILKYDDKVGIQTNVAGPSNLVDFGEVYRTFIY